MFAPWTGQRPNPMYGYGQQQQTGMPQANADGSFERAEFGGSDLLGMMLLSLTGVNTPGFQSGAQNAAMAAYRRRKEIDAQNAQLEKLTVPQYQKVGNSIVEIPAPYQRKGNKYVRNQTGAPATPIYTEPAEPTGAFAGTGMEAQALNIVLDPSIPENDPRKILAKQRVTRATTIATPEGTLERPGYNLGALYDNAEGSPTGGATQGRFTPKLPTQQEQRADYTVGSMRKLHSGATDYVPSGWESGADQLTPDFLTGYLVSNDYKDYKGTADEWAANLIFLRSGATAREDEVERAFNNFWPQPGDDEARVKDKKQLRQQAMDEAERSYLSRTGSAGSTQGNAESTQGTIEWWRNPETGNLEPKP